MRTLAIFLPFLNLLIIPVIAGIFRLNKTLTSLKFYTRKLCEAVDPEIRYGKDLE